MKAQTTKNIIIPLFIILILFVPFKVRAEKKIHVIITFDNNFFPYSFVKDEKPNGIYYHLFQKIFENFDPKYQIELKPLPWKLALEEVKGGSAFAVFPVYKIPGTRPWLDYSSPIFQEEIAVFCHNIKKKWPKDYANLKIGINFDYAYPNSIYKIFNDNNMNILAVDNTESALRLYHQNIFDCYVNNQHAVFATNNANHFREINRIAILDKEFSYLGFSNAFFDNFKYGKDFIQKFNKQLDKVKRNGTLDLMVHNFITTNSNQE